MATLKNIVSQEEILLLPQHSFGRRAGVVNTHVALPSVSQNHATIHWDGERWVIADHSRNGTWVDENYLHRSTPSAVTRFELTAGSVIRFCQYGDSSGWKVKSVS